MKARVGTLFVTLAVVAAATVVLPAAATGATGRHIILSSAFRAPSAHGLLAQGLAEPTGPFSISGTVLDFDGTPFGQANVEWGWYDPNAPVWFGPDVFYQYGGSTPTGADGTFSFANVTSSPGNDTLTAFADGWENGYILDNWANDFSTQSSYVLRPGRAPLTITGLPDGATAWVTVGDAATGSASSTPSLVDDSGYVMTAAPGFRTAMVSIDGKRNAALDWTSPGGELVPVSPGETSAQEIVLDWSQARRGSLAGTSWQHSARPGDLVTFVLKGWPAGYQASFVGSAYGAAEMVRWYDTTLASQGADQTYRVSLRVPRNVPLDDLYNICAYRSDAPGTLLYVDDSLQPCKFRATQTLIRSGEAIQLRGLVLGDSRRVDILQRHTAAGRPSGRAARGWTKVATLTAKRDGVFRSGWKRPDRTTWYVARISGYYFPVYTPVVKVTVR